MNPNHDRQAFEPERPTATGAHTAEQRMTTSQPRPRWVKTVGIVAGLLVLVFVILNVTGLGPGAGGHGPGRHTGGATSGASHTSSP